MNMETDLANQHTQLGSSLQYAPLPRTWVIRRWQWAMQATSFFGGPSAPVLLITNTEVQTLMALAVGLTLQAVGAWVSVRIYFDLPNLAQRRRDSVAERIDWQLQFSDSHMPFVLYLRPFLTTGHLTRRTRRGKVRLEFESVLVDAISYWCPVLGLANPRATHVGAGRVFAQDEHWQEVIRRLVEYSDAVFILLALGDSEATEWELSFLRQNDWLKKTIAIMPPQSDDLNIEYLWDETTTRLKKSHIYLPKYRTDGAFFRIGNDGSAHELEDIPKSWFRKQIRHALESFR